MDRLVTTLFLLALVGCATPPAPSEYSSVAEFAAEKAKQTGGMLGRALVPVRRYESTQFYQLETQVGRDDWRLYSSLKDYCVETGGVVYRDEDNLDAVSDVVGGRVASMWEQFYPGFEATEVGGKQFACTANDEILFFVTSFTRPYRSDLDGSYDLTDYLILESRTKVSPQEFEQKGLVAIRDWVARVSGTL